MTLAMIDLDQKIKQAVTRWRDNNYAEGTSPFTKRLVGQ